MTGENTARLRELVRIMREVANRIAVEVAYIEHQQGSLRNAQETPDRPALRVVNGKGGDTR